MDIESRLKIIGAVVSLIGTLIGLVITIDQAIKYFKRKRSESEWPESQTGNNPAGTGGETVGRSASAAWGAALAAAVSLLLLIASGLLSGLGGRTEKTTGSAAPSSSSHSYALNPITRSSSSSTAASSLSNADASSAEKSSTGSASRVDKPKQPPFFGRMWTDVEGKQLGEAELVKVESGRVHVKGRDGEVVELPVKQLSSGDLFYLATGVLLSENFSKFKEGDSTEWGRDAAVTKLADGSNWLRAFQEGQRRVGQKLYFPRSFTLEFAYAATVETGENGKSKISLIDEEGGTQAIVWSWKEKRGVEQSSVEHTFTLPDGAKAVTAVACSRLGGAFAHTTATCGPGAVKVVKDGEDIKVLVDGKLVVAGHIDDSKQYKAFEVDLFQRTNPKLQFVTANCLTAFRITRTARNDAPGGPKGSKTTDGTLILRTKAPVAAGVEAWVEIEGKRKADWKAGTKEVSLALAAGDYRIAVYSVANKVKRIVFDETVAVPPDTTLPLDVE